jgi:hypothetical protein
VSTYIDPLPCIPLDPYPLPSRGTAGSQVNTSLLLKPTSIANLRTLSSIAILKILFSQQTDTRVRPLEPYRKCRTCGPPTQSSVASIICCAPSGCQIRFALLCKVSLTKPTVSRRRLSTCILSVPGTAKQHSVVPPTNQSASSSSARVRNARSCRLLSL